MPELHYVTAEGYAKLKAELEHMISVERPAISKAIGEARDKGDLSENAEYDAAREAQGLLELKISQLKEIIANSRVIDESKINTDCVQILNKVKVKNLGNNAVMQFTLVGESEANLAGDWKHYTFELDEFMGKNIYVAFVNENEDQSLVIVDNILVERYTPFLTALMSETTVVAQDD